MRVEIKVILYLKSIWYKIRATHSKGKQYRIEVQ